MARRRIGVWDARLAAMLGREADPPYTTDWPGLLIDEKESLRFQPALGLVFGAEDLAAIRERCARPPYAHAMELIRSAAAEALKREPERRVREFIPTTARGRYARPRDRQDEMHTPAIVCAFVGLVDRDPALVGFTTAYDKASNKLYERHLHAENRSFLYNSLDSLGRLLQNQRGTLASGGASVASAITLPGTDEVVGWTLDSVGNWRRRTATPVGGSSATEVRQHNKLHQITKFGSTDCVYDANGNMTDDGEREFAYDVFNRVVRVSRKGQTASSSSSSSSSASA